MKMSLSLFTLISLFCTSSSLLAMQQFQVFSTAPVSTAITSKLQQLILQKNPAAKDIKFANIKTIACLRSNNKPHKVYCSKPFNPTHNTAINISSLNSGIDWFGILSSDIQGSYYLQNKQHTFIIQGQVIHCKVTTMKNPAASLDEAKQCQIDIDSSQIN